MSRSCTSLRLRWHRGFLGIAGVPCTSKGRQFRDCASISQPSALQRKTGHEHKFYCICSLGATGKVPIGSSNSKIARANCSCSAAPPLRHCTALLFSTQVHPRSQVQLRAPWALPTRGSGDRKRSGPLNSLSFCPAVAPPCGCDGTAAFLGSQVFRAHQKEGNSGIARPYRNLRLFSARPAMNTSSIAYVAWARPEKCP